MQLASIKMVNLVWEITNQRQALFNWRALEESTFRDTVQPEIFPSSRLMNSCHSEATILSQSLLVLLLKKLRKKRKAKMEKTRMEELIRRDLQMINRNLGKVVHSLTDPKWINTEVVESIMVNHRLKETIDSWQIHLYLKIKERKMVKFYPISRLLRRYFLFKKWL